MSNNQHGPDSNIHNRFTSVANPDDDPHLNGEYFKNNPTWHVEYSPSKAKNIHALLERRRIQPQTVCEVGCGAGEVLRQLHLRMPANCVFSGYDVAPPAIEIAKKNAENERLRFTLADFGQVEAGDIDLLLVLEVVDHVEDYYGFLRFLRKKAKWKIFSFSLDISVQSALRSGAFSQRRNVHTHMHHFNKETALGTLEHTGYEIVEYFYTSSLAVSRSGKWAKPIRSTIFKLNPDLAVRLFGGYSLMILAR